MNQSMHNTRILIVDDEESLRRLLSVVFCKEGCEVVTAVDGRQALELAASQAFGLVIMDMRMPNVGGLEALRQIRRARPELPVILMTAYAAVDTAVEALKQGAFDYIVKPFDIDELKNLARKAIERSRLRADGQLAERLELPNSNDRRDTILTQSANMMALCRDIAKVSQTNATVLIIGESGTGKELVAKAIHYYSKRAASPFIKVNCGALPENLLESTLFGHAKGAFTGAHANQTGLFERANHGTLLLDEVAEMTPNLQVKFLRVLQEKEFEPIGSGRTQRTDFRLIASTNKRLHEMVETGGFREDLFYRLNVITLYSPPLREKPDDIMLLARHFAQRFCMENNKELMDFSIDAIEALNSYHWPGNVRELANAIERAVIVSAGAFIGPEDLPDKITASRRPAQVHTAVHGAPALDGNTSFNLRDSIKHYEKDLIETALRQNSGHRENTARALGVSKRTLLYKLQEYGIDGD